MNINKPIISICVPTYNGEKYLEEALNSILSQTFNDYEVIIVDDQSTDNTVDISKKFSEKDQRIHCCQNEKNLGLVGNWNKCIELAKGEWIKFLFQDDLLHPACLERMLLNANHEHPFIFCQREVIYDDRDESSATLAHKIIELPYLKTIFSDGGYINPSRLCQIALAHLDINFFGEPTTALIHRDLFSRYGLFNAHLEQLCDLEFWLRIGVNEGVFFVPETLASFRVHNTSTTSKNLEKRVFIMEYLDKLALRFEIAFSEHFASLRSLAKRSTPPLNLKKAFYNLVTQTEWYVNNAIHSGADPSHLLLNELETFILQHPHLRKTSFFWSHKLYQWLNQNILWRFAR